LLSRDQYPEVGKSGYVGGIDQLRVLYTQAEGCLESIVWTIPPCSNNSPMVLKGYERHRHGVKGSRNADCRSRFVF
jgi:hypothetical protein